MDKQQMTPQQAVGFLASAIKSGEPFTEQCEQAVSIAMAALSHAEGEAEPVALEPPEFHSEGMGCGLEDRGITDRYEAMEYGFREAIEQYEVIIEGYGQLYTHPAPQVAVPEDAAQDRRIVSAMAADLGRIAEALDIDPDEGGAAPILAAINEMKSRCAVPSGWKPVPVEPTNEMISAGADASNAYRVDIMRSYDAMLAAAPTAPAGETQKPEYGDAYQGAREDLLIWKRRALAAEAKLREQPVSGPDGLPEPPLDAAYDGRMFADRVELKYGFQFQGGAIEDCYEWQQLRQCLVAMAEYVERAPDEREIAQAARDVLAERRRQVEAEGWTPEHDDEHAFGEMATAAASYAIHASHYCAFGMEDKSLPWPWGMEWWKPTTPRRDLIKAGALILAEIERLDRARLRAGKEGEDHE